MEALKNNGYHTGHTAKGWAPGNPGEVDGKRRELTGPAFNKHKTTAPTSAINSNDYAANFEDFLDQKPEGEPFSFWYGSTEPHRAYEFRSGIEKGGKRLEDIDKIPSFWPDNDTIRADMLDYAYEIEYFDQHLQRMLNSLEDRGELENTIVVVTADNGMPFPRIKGQEYEYSNHLPLAIMWPAGISRAVFLPGGPTYSRPSQFVKAITSARRGGADGTCGFAFSVTEEDFDNEWRWKSVLLASHANFPTPELGAYSFVEEPSRLIEELAISELNIISGASDKDNLIEKLESFFPGKIERLEALPKNKSNDSKLFVVIGGEEDLGQKTWPYDIQQLKPGKGSIQMSDRIIRIDGSDPAGLQNAEELFLRFAEIALAELKCKELIESRALNTQL